MKLDSLENKRKILKNFLEICAKEGVNELVLKESFEKSEIDFKYKELIFEEGLITLTEFYIDELILDLSSQIKSQIDFNEFKIREKIAFCLFKFFELQKSHKDSCHELFKFYFKIENFQKVEYGAKPSLSAFKNLAKISDKIWYLIGDKSTDYNYYTKRLTLSKIIVKTFLVFVKDDSQNLSKTKESIDLEIEKVMKFEKFKSKIKNFNCSTDKKHDIKDNLKEFFLDKNSKLKDPIEMVRNLPFIRLFNK